jgi:hypothetical protein
LQWALALSGTNVLIIGAREADLHSVCERIAEPVTVIAEPLCADLIGTCVISDALRLTPAQQKALRNRLNREPRLRLVTLSAVPLYPRIEAGQFDRTLYYRLNTITVHWTSE